MVNCNKCGKQLTSPSACSHCGTTSGQKQQIKRRHLLLRKYGISTYPFQAKQSNQLSFDTAEIFQLHQEIDENWFQATSVEYNANGLVPKSHISLIPESSEIYKKYGGDENTLVNKVNDKQVKRTSMAIVKYTTNNFFYSTNNHLLYQIFLFLSLQDLQCCLFVSKAWNKVTVKSLLSTHLEGYNKRVEENKQKKKEEMSKEKRGYHDLQKIFREDPFCVYMQNFPVLADHNINVDDFFNVNVCILGAKNSGKTSVLDFLINDKFTESYTSSQKNEVHQKKQKIDGENVFFQITDTSSNKEEQDQSIMKNNAFLLFYSVNDRNGFVEAEKFYRMITSIHANKAYLPIFLVGTKMDIGESTRVVSYEEGLALSKSIKLDGYFEISSKAGLFVSELFVNIARAYSLSVVLNEQNSSQQKESLTPTSGNTPKFPKKVLNSVPVQQRSNSDTGENSKCFIF